MAHTINNCKKTTENKQACYINNHWVTVQYQTDILPGEMKICTGERGNIFKYADDLGVAVRASSSWRCIFSD